MSKNVLIIGGLGHWGQKHYVPLLINSNICNELIVCDIKNEKKINKHYKYVKLNLGNEIDEIKELIKQYSISVVIIATPPIYHDYYLINLIPTGVNFICDKPMVAIKGQSFDEKKAKEVKKRYNEILKLKKQYNVKIYTPLRRRVQNFYNEIYKNVNLINDNFDQNITFASLYENDGCHRWDDEMTIDFAHGYNDGLGKLTHTGYHILDIVAKLIDLGCNNIKSLECQVLHAKTVADSSKSKSIKNLAKLLSQKISTIKHNDIVQSAELDIGIKFTISFYDDVDSFIYVHIHHGGVTNRVIKHYDDINTGDQGRTDDSTFTIEQGPMQNIYSTIFANDTVNEERKSVLFIKRHILAAKKLHLKAEQIIDLKPSNEISTEEIMKHIILAAQGNKKYQDKYEEVEIEHQKFTMELYYAVLLSKTKKAVIKWKKGDLI